MSAFIFFLLIKFHANTFANEPVNPEINGATVLFSKSDPLQQNLIHKKLKAKLIYRAEFMPIDVVGFDDTKLNHNIKAVVDLCAKYRKLPEVKACDPNVKLIADESAAKSSDNTEAGTCDNCEIQNSTLNPKDNKNIADIASTIKSKNSDCAPYPGIDNDVYDKAPIKNIITGKQLTLFWAQEAVGAPETAAYLKDYKNNTKVEVGILDAQFALNSSSMPTESFSEELKACYTDKPAKCGGNTESNSHGTLALNIFVGKTPYGVGHTSKVTKLVLSDGKFNGGYVEAIDQIMKPENKIPKLINMSMRVPEKSKLNNSYDVLSTAFAKLTDKTILVAAAGNAFPDPIGIHDLKGVNAITVGALQPNGLQTEYSQADNKIAISAPVGYDIQTIADDKSQTGKQLTSFSGTSAATPVVSGALTNVLSYLPGLSSDEARKLLEKTAILTADGSKSLNAYALVRVAAKLANNWPKWPNNRNLIHGDEIYNFIEEAKELFKEATEKFKNASKSSNSSNYCSLKLEALSLLRKSFFLNPRSTETRNKLYAEYEAAGYQEQAQFYGLPIKVKAIPAVNTEIMNHKLIRAIGNGNVKSVEDLLNSGASITARGGSVSGRKDASIYHILDRANLKVDDKKNIFDAINKKTSNDPVFYSDIYTNSKLAIEFDKNDVLKNNITKYYANDGNKHRDENIINTDVKNLIITSFRNKNLSSTIMLLDHKPELINEKYGPNEFRLIDLGLMSESKSLICEIFRRDTSDPMINKDGTKFSRLSIKRSFQCKN
ncbi:MAG: hypothetical protein A2Z20_12860 [Bdellovibrionales bacterium RBG_16_40_8]|nr:MAG: hypothetical protein A2Z20_12860 [Bdellovibrionales bacterium RBG_16_40_8]